MNQDKVFLECEGDQWFLRNKIALENDSKFDWPCYLIDLLKQKEEIRTIIELGCSNGWRLHQLSQKLGQGQFVGVDASLEAIQDGKKLYPELSLHQGLLSQVPLQEEFDLAIVNGVLCWVDRSSLVQSITEIDRLIKDGGFLLIGDFLPDFQHRRHYHHRPTEKIYTYKQDYAKIFESLGTYKEIARFTFNHDKRQLAIEPCESSSRYSCVMLHKSLYGFYPEIA